MNKVILLGRLVRDPEVRYTQSAEPLAVCSFTVAVDKPYSRNRQEGEATADFINCICFGKRGEAIGQFFQKGKKIALSGRIQSRTYTDKQNNKRYVTEVIADDFEFVESKSASAGGSGEFPYSAAADNDEAAPEGLFFPNEENADDSNLPFI